MPFRGRARDDIRPGLRIIGYKRRVVIAFLVVEAVVVIVGVFMAEEWRICGSLVRPEQR